MLETRYNVVYPNCTRICSIRDNKSVERYGCARYTITIRLLYQSTATIRCWM